MEVQLEDLLQATLQSYRAALQSMAECGKQVFPQFGDEMRQTLLQLQKSLSSDASPAAVLETQKQVDVQLREWGNRASDYLKERTNEVKEIMTLMAKAAQTVSERDQKYVGQFEQLGSRLESIANLEDLKAIRQSLSQSATEMKSRVVDMSRDSRQSIAQLHAELRVYQARVEEVERLAFRDFLTGLDNRQYVEQQLAFRVKRAQAFCLILFDLNNFKLVNDSWGHLAGDELLKQFAQELRSFFRPMDTVGRWGGDEFIAVMDCGLHEAMRHIENLPKWLFGDYKITVGGVTRKMQVRASFGVAAWQTGETALEVVGRADAAMYGQKNSLPKAVAS
jgi:diguanylate cyclase (GGDEF)-like protein